MAIWSKSIIEEGNNNKDLKDLFDEQSYNRLYNFVMRLKRLAPLDKSDKLMYLENLINYVDMLVNGDEIRQITISPKLTENAKKSIEELSAYSREALIKSYIEIKSSLENELEELSNSRTTLKNEVERLEEARSSLKAQLESDGKELGDIKTELNYLKLNGKREAEREISARKEQLEKELATLKEERQGLLKVNEELSDAYKKQSELLTKLRKDEVKITWECIKNGDLIYGTDYKTIYNYIQSIKDKYRLETGKTEEEVEREFILNASGLNNVASLLKQFQEKQGNEYTYSLKSIVNLENNDRWYSDSILIYRNIVSVLDTIKLPVYKKVKENIDVTEALNSKNPGVDQMLRELYFQRMAIEAVTKQKILEAELETVVNVLKSVAGENFDYSKVINMYSELDGDFAKKLLPNE